MVLAGPYAVAALLLGVGGVAKVIRPDPAQRALATMALRIPPNLIRIGALAETGLAVAALTTSNLAVAVAVAVSFAAFTLFIAAAIVRPTTIGDCGCFGSSASPPTVLHLAINAVGTIVAAAASAAQTPSLYAEVRHSPGLGVPYVALVAVTTWLTCVCLSELPLLQALVRSQPAGGQR